MIMRIENFGHVFGVDYDESNVSEIVRSIRGSLLDRSDWTQLPDSPLTDQKRSEWATYRQQLRDILETNSTNLAETIFPTPPTTE